MPLPDEPQHPKPAEEHGSCLEGPDLIISSGAAVAVPFFLIGKMLGSKCVYVEVFDRVDKPTMTGRMLNGVADLFVVQWPEQLDVYKSAVDLGSIF